MPDLPGYSSPDFDEGLFSALEEEGEVGGEDGVLQHSHHGLELFLDVKKTNVIISLVGHFDVTEHRETSICRRTGADILLGSQFYVAEHNGSFAEQTL